MCEKDYGLSPQTMAKPGLTQNKVMLCAWFDWNGIGHYGLLPSVKTIDSDLYCQQLMRFKKAIEKNLYSGPPRPSYSPE